MLQIAYYETAQKTPRTIKKTIGLYKKKKVQKQKHITIGCNLE